MLWIPYVRSRRTMECGSGYPSSDCPFQHDMCPTFNHSGCCTTTIPSGHSLWLSHLPSAENTVIEDISSSSNRPSILLAHPSWWSNWSRIWSGQPIYLNDLVQIQWRESGCRARIRIQLFFDIVSQTLLRIHNIVNNASSLAPTISLTFWLPRSIYHRYDTFLII